MKNRHRTVARLKAQEEKRLRERDARIIKEIISGVAKEVMDRTKVRKSHD